jgi:1-aminocyclopropane-1-carboxylate deaminase/D-cysteine desulfhydrase-like pyridoxal-dependent ACC family enzyme
MNLTRLPRISLARLPTPLDDAPRLASALGVARVLVKRDDLTDLALGGNKVRKLEFLLGEALAQRADVIITTAASQSNFLRLAAAAARRAGVRPVLVVRGRPDEAPQGNLLLMRVFGAEMHFVDTADPYAESTIALMRDIADRVRRRGGRPHLIHIATFSGGLASAGYVPAAFELADQLRERGARADHVVVAVGSGTTQAGLLLGLHLAGLDARVLGVSVNTPAARLRGLVAEQMRAAAGIVDVAPPAAGDDAVEVTDAHVGPGYGIATPESAAAVPLAARAAGLLFDPIYTGKAWAALEHAVRAGTIDRRATVVFVHTGGAPNVFLHARALAGVAVPDR